MTDIRIGDCLSVMPTIPENSVDSIITDPPYGLDFMGKSWDHGVPGVEFWQAALRVAKPGAILLAFGGTRTVHRLACAIEDAGWEIRDGMCYLYGSGFPKSLDISKAIDKAAGAEREVTGTVRAGFGNRNGKTDLEGGIMLNSLPEDMKHIDVTVPSTPAAHLWQGWGTALKPAWEPIIVAMKPLEGTYAENAQKWGVAGLNIDGSRVSAEGYTNGGQNRSIAFGMNGLTDKQPRCDGALGRWPANLLLDEEAARLLDEQSGESKSPAPYNPTVDCSHNVFFTEGFEARHGGEHGDHGGASRFFYTAKASSSERNAGLEEGNSHPTIKPVSLMRYLCKLTCTPTGGVVLDPFMGSGTTGIACILEHRDFIGIEIDENYAEIAKKRIADMEGPLFQEAA